MPAACEGVGGVPIFSQAESRTTPTMPRNSDRVSTSEPAVSTSLLSTLLVANIEAATMPGKRSASRLGRGGGQGRCVQGQSGGAIKQGRTLDARSPRRHPKAVEGLCAGCMDRRGSMAASALRSVSWRNVKPLASALSGSTCWPPSSSSSARSPRSRSAKAGIGIKAGRRNARPSSRAKSALRTGTGAVALTAPQSFGVAITWAMSRMRSSRSIQDIHCRPPAHRAAEAELERRQHAAEQPAFGAEHQPDPQPHHAHAMALRASPCAPRPRTADG